jgi:integrase
MAYAGPRTRRSASIKSFRIGKVRAYRRGKVWYLCYREQGRRRQPRIGLDQDSARQTASEINAQLEVGLPSALGFEPVSITDVRQQWLDHHEHIRRSSVRTIERYRAATNHLLRFITDVQPVRRVSDFRATHAEEFVRYLRSIKVTPNGHANAAKRRLRDNSVKYILETCSTLMNYAQRHRHLSPYAENPFRTIEIGRVPIEDAKPIFVFTTEQERQFFDACDDWQFPLFLLLLFTGLRPGELTHLLLPDDLDLSAGWLHVCNKPALGWQIKTRNERDIPLHPILNEVLRRLIGSRRTGPVFCQRRCQDGFVPPLEGLTADRLEREALQRVAEFERSGGAELSRRQKQTVVKKVWRDMGAIREDWVRIEFMRVSQAIGLSFVTAPKTFRHTFATILQDANVDPLIRNELMGHSPATTFGTVAGLGTTGLYTHTRPETKRRQLVTALNDRPALTCAATWLARRAFPSSGIPHDA